MRNTNEQTRRRTGDPKNAADVARQQGARAGATPSAAATDCPYRSGPLAAAWLHGFRHERAICERRH